MAPDGVTTHDPEGPPRQSCKRSGSRTQRSLIPVEPSAPSSPASPRPRTLNPGCVSTIRPGCACGENRRPGRDSDPATGCPRRVRPARRYAPGRATTRGGTARNACRKPLVIANQVPLRKARIDHEGPPSAGPTDVGVSQDDRQGTPSAATGSSPTTISPVIASPATCRRLTPKQRAGDKSHQQARQRHPVSGQHLGAEYARTDSGLIRSCLVHPAWRLRRDPGTGRDHRHHSSRTTPARPM